MLKWIMGIIGAVVAGIIVCWLTTGLQEPSGIKESGIYEPKDGGSVFHKTTIEGWYNDSGIKNDLWLVVQPVESPFYHPQPGPIPKDEDGRWRGIAYIGESAKKNIGEEFLIFFMRVDLAASKIFADYFKNSESSGKWLGLQILPEGATSIDSVRVVRK